jgi:hypothetical protein
MRKIGLVLIALVTGSAILSPASFAQNRHYDAYTASHYGEAPAHSGISRIYKAPFATN